MKRKLKQFFLHNMVLFLAIVLCISNVCNPLFAYTTKQQNNGNLAAGKIVKASGVEKGKEHLSPDKIVDGIKSGNSRWSSEFEEMQWIYVDLGEKMALNKVNLFWENPAVKYKVQLSNSAYDYDWTTVYSADNNVDKENIVLFEAYEARYIRVLCEERTPVLGVKYGYSLYELEVYHEQYGNIALEKNVSSSGVEAGKPQFAADLVVDGNREGNSRWSSIHAEEQWITIDLGEKRVFDKISLYWEAAMAKKYKLFVSDDGENWSEIYEETNNIKNENIIELKSSINSRYIKLLCTERTVVNGGKWGYSLYEFEVYGMLQEGDQIPPVNHLPETLPEVDKSVYMDPNRPVEERVNALISQMTLQEKIAQMAMGEICSGVTEKDMIQYNLGTILNVGGGGAGAADGGNSVTGWKNRSQRYMAASRKTRLGVPALYGVDAVHGHSTVPDSVMFPQNIGLGSALIGDEEAVTPLLEKMGEVTAKEIRATGINYNFAPCLAIPHDSRWGRTYEGFSVNPEVVSKAGVAVVRGMQGKSDLSELKEEDRVGATIKHYIGEGATLNGGNRGNVNMDYDSAEFQKLLKEELFPPYVESINEGAVSVMVSFNSVGGLKMHAHGPLIDLLKGSGDNGHGLQKLNWDGVVITDWDGVSAIPVPSGTKDAYKERVKLSINAGCDIFMFPYSWKQFITSTNELVEEGSVSVDRIDDAVKRILRLKFRLGLFEENDKALDESAFASAEGIALNEELARKSLVLLKNDEINGSPIMQQLADMDKIFVAGRGGDNIGMQCGGWSLKHQGFDGNLTRGSSILSGLQRLKGVDSVKYSKTGEGITDEYDAVIVAIGESGYAEDAGQRVNLDLQEEDKEVLNKAKESGLPVVVVLLSGRPMEIGDYLEQMDGLVAAWLPGSDGGNAIADVLFDEKYDFVGKSSLPWAWSVKQFPLTYKDSYNNDKLLFEYGYGLTKDEKTPKINDRPEELDPAGNYLEISSDKDSPTRIIAVNYSDAKGVSQEVCTDSGQGFNLSGLQAGSFMEYQIDVKVPGIYKLNVRVASDYNERECMKLVDGRNEPHILKVPNTGGWQNWDNITEEIYLNKGQQTLHIDSLINGYNVYWYELSLVEEDISGIETNKQLLQMAVESARAVTEKDLNQVIPTVVRIFKQFLEKAEAVLADEYATQEEIDNATDNLILVMHYLDFTKANKNDLQILVDEALSITDNQLETLAPEIVQQFKKVLEKAQNLLIDEDALQYEVDKVLEELKEIMKDFDFTKIDKSHLEAFVNKVKDLEEDKYLVNTWTTFAKALHQAQIVLENDKVTQQDVDDAYTSLVQAFINLRLKPNKDLLNDLINQAETLDQTKYSLLSYSRVEKALLDAKTVYANSNATQVEVEKAQDILANALNELEVINNKKNKTESNINSIKTADSNAITLFGTMTVISLVCLCLFKKKINKKDSRML